MKARIITLATLLAAALVQAAESQLIRLRLEGGLGVIPTQAVLSNGLPQPVRRDIGFEFVVRGGQWDKDVAGYAVFYDPRFAERETSSYNKADHDTWLREFRADGSRVRLALDVTVNKDMWGSGGGEADYVIEATRDGDTFAGSFTGRFNGQEVTGKVTGRGEPLWPTPVKGWKPVQNGEHPRLVFRQSDIPALRERAKSPEGQAIVARLRELLRGKPNNESAGYFAAGHASLFTLTGDAAHAQAARQMVEDIFAVRPGVGNTWRSTEERHLRAPPVAGVALAFDLCHDAWDEPFRRRVVVELERKAREMMVGLDRAEYNDNPPSNHYGICNGAGALAALAILGEPWDFDTPRPPQPDEAVTVKAPANFQPPAVVPVTRLVPGQMLTNWLLAVAPQRGVPDPKAWLAKLATGRTIALDGKTIAFEPMNPVLVESNKYTEGRFGLELFNATRRTPQTTLYYHAVLENDRERFVQFPKDGGVRLWVSGQRLERGGAMTLGPGRHPVLLLAEVGNIPNAWGRMWIYPRLIETTPAKMKADAAKPLAVWQRQHDQWLALGKTVHNGPQLVRLAETHLRRHFSAAYGDHGWGTEGDGYTRYAMTAGLLPAVQAFRVAAGKDFGDGRGLEWYLPLLVARAIVAEDGKVTLPAYGPGGNPWEESLFRSGDFALGFSGVPERQLPAVRWFFDRSFGLGGKRNFDLHNPHQAIYALANYPFEVAARNPSEILPKAIADQRKGYHVFRNGWNDANDFVATVYFKSEPRVGWSYHDAGSFRIFGLGTQWAVKLDSRDKNQPNPGSRLAENVVAVPGTRGWLGGPVTHFESKPDGSGVVSARLDDVFRGPHPTNVDLGIRATRSFAVDYSGACGAPALFAVADRIEGAGANAPVWVMHTGGKPGVNGNTFTIEGEDGATMRGTFVHPPDVKLTVTNQTLRATGGGEFRVVMTVQKTPAPTVQQRGARVVIGDCQLEFDGGSIVLRR